MLPYIGLNSTGMFTSDSFNQYIAIVLCNQVKIVDSGQLMYHHDMNYEKLTRLSLSWITCLSKATKGHHT